VPGRPSSQAPVAAYPAGIATYPPSRGEAGRALLRHKDLATVTARGRTYAVASSPETIYGTKKPGIGKNKRTAKFIGGGAAAGSVIGAIAGGGAGALVGGTLVRSVKPLDDIYSRILANLA
jgi:hypothetical protein